MLEYAQERPLVAFSDAYSAKVAGVVGLVHIICGLAALTANIVGIMFGANIPLAAGVWSSIFFVSSGSLALAGACIKTKRLVVSTLGTHSKTTENHPAQKPLAERGGTPPPLNGQNPLSSF